MLTVRSPYPSGVLAGDVGSALETAGYVHLREAFGAEQMRSVVWRSLRQSGVLQEDARTWITGSPDKSITRSVQSHRGFRTFWSSKVASALDGLLGPDCWSRPAGAGDLLITFPDGSSAVRQIGPFHSDFAMDIPASPMFVVNIFAFLDDVAPANGGTLIIRGSHRVVHRYIDSLPPGFPPNRAAAQFAADHEWLMRPTADPLIGASIDCNGIEVQVEELAGRAGDIVLTHPWTLHVGASNPGTSPRLMLRHQVWRTPSA